MLPPVLAPSRTAFNRLSFMFAQQNRPAIPAGTALNPPSWGADLLQFSGKRRPLKHTLAAALGLIGTSVAQVPTATAGQSLDLRLPGAISAAPDFQPSTGGLALHLPRDYDPGRINVPGNMPDMIRDTLRQLGLKEPKNLEDSLLMLASVAERLTGKAGPIPPHQRAEVLRTLLYGGKMPAAIPDALIPPDVRKQLPDIPLTNARVSPAELNGIKLTELRPTHVKIGQMGLPKYGDQVWKNMRGLVNDTTGLFDPDKLTVKGLPAKQMVEDAIRLLRNQGLQPDKVYLPLVLSLASAFKLEDLRYDGKTLNQLANDPGYKGLLKENGHFKSLVDLLKVLQDPDNITINGVKLKETQVTVEAKLSSVLSATPLDPTLKGRKLAPGETGGEISLVLAATPVEVTAEPQADGRVTGVTGIALAPGANVGVELLGVHRWGAVDDPFALYTSIMGLAMPRSNPNAISPYGEFTLRIDPVSAGVKLGNGFELHLRPLGIQADYGRSSVKATARGTLDLNGADWRVDVQQGPHKGIIVSHVMDGIIRKTWEGIGLEAFIGGGVIQDKNGPGTKGGGERPIEPFLSAGICQRLGWWILDGNSVCLTAQGKPDIWGGYPGGTARLGYTIPLGAPDKKK